jgi:hypothetical protein
VNLIQKDRLRASQSAHETPPVFLDMASIVFSGDVEIQALPGFDTATSRSRAHESCHFSGQPLRPQGVGQ